MTNTKYAYWSIKGEKIPVKQVFEYRDNVRFALASKNFILRIPIQVNESEKGEYLEEGKRWISKVLEENPVLIGKFQQRVYVEGEILACYDHNYKIQLTGPGTHHFFLSRKDSLLKIPLEKAGQRQVSGSEYSKTMIRLLNKSYKILVHLRSKELAIEKDLPTNFNFSIKYMTSRWGSCSKQKGKISINTRLLLAPQNILDSVILHELCHLVHPNHSQAFWSLLQKVDPDYVKHSKWLKTNGPLLKL